MRELLFVSIASLSVVLSACGPPKAEDADTILKNIQQYAGKRVVIKGKFRSGARCGQPREPGEKWQAYCGEDCSVCKGPVVLDSKLDLSQEGLDDWPLILGGTYKGKDIRCRGPLNQVECYPFKEGRSYVVQGEIEAQRPPKLLVERFWDLEEGS